MVTMVQNQKGHVFWGDPENKPGQTAKKKDDKLQKGITYNDDTNAIRETGKPLISKITQSKATLAVQDVE